MAVKQEKHCFRGLNTSKKFYEPFLWMGINCFKAPEPVRGDSLLCTTISPGVSGAHLIDLGRLKTESTLEPSSDFAPLDQETRALTTRPLIHQVCITFALTHLMPLDFFIPTENVWFSDIFSWYRKWPVECSGLIVIAITKGKIHWTY